jgi:hypothetical protein
MDVAGKGFKASKDTDLRFIFFSFFNNYMDYFPTGEQVTALAFGKLLKTYF